MSDHKFDAEIRNDFGKGAARKLRAAGKTPAVIYGHGNATRHISLPARQTRLALRTKNAILELSIDGKSELVLVKSAQKEPVKQEIEHVDLVEVKKGEKVHVEVPVHVVGEPMGGTVVDVVHSTVAMEAEATNIPEYVELHISKENPAGHHYTVSDLVVPGNVTLELAAEENVAIVTETRAAEAEETTTETTEESAESAAEESSEDE
jgi:large subunit ribosomal protein L25